ncbi:MAG: glycosyltransferase family 2 protein [Gemmataceae bacterium]
MNDAPLVSVIIPCYNQARYLPSAIESTLAQSYAPIEIIVVNDGSPDDTEKVARAFGERILYIVRRNGGVSAARNTGIARAGGRFLKFLDADDHLHPEQIAWQMEALAGREDAVAVTATRVYRDGKPQEHLDLLPTAKALLPDFFREYACGGLKAWLLPATLVRAVGGFDESLRFTEDWEFLIRMGLQGAQLFTDQRIGCYYRLWDGSATSNQLGTALTWGRVLTTIHDKLRDAGRADWFGLELLKAEQGAYQTLIQMQVQDAHLLASLLARIRELQKRVGFGQYGWRFRLMARCLGYARAERIRGRVVRLRTKKVSDSRDPSA